LEALHERVCRLGFVEDTIIPRLHRRLREQPDDGDLCGIEGFEPWKTSRGARRTHLPVDIRLEASRVAVAAGGTVRDLSNAFRIIGFGRVDRRVQSGEFLPD
jgi:hypothetical protein